MADIRARLRILSFRKTSVRPVSTALSGAGPVGRSSLARPAVRFAKRALASAAMLLLLAAPSATGQYEPDDEPILPDEINRLDVDMSARYVHQWRAANGEFVLVFSGGFELEIGRRMLSADDAVVWIARRQSDQGDGKYYELTVYLSGAAEVRELGGTTTEDSALLVSNIRTQGRIIKHHDAHSPEQMDDSALYQRALAAREGRYAAAPPRARAVARRGDRASRADRDDHPAHSQNPLAIYERRDRRNPGQTHRPGGHRRLVSLARRFRQFRGNGNPRGKTPFCSCRRAPARRSASNCAATRANRPT